MVIRADRTVYSRPVVDIRELIAVERRRAADLVEALTPDQQAVQSLCSAWSVADVAGHLTMPFQVSTPSFVLGVLTSGGFDRFSVKTSRRLAAAGPAALARTLRDNASHPFTPPGFGFEAPLTDCAVHTRDMARPLGLDVTASADAWRVVLPFLVTPKAARAFTPKRALDGLRLVAEDIGWSHGDGPVVAGPAEAVALALAGRGVALADLTGDGVRALAGRLSAG